MTAAPFAYYGHRLERDPLTIKEGGNLVSTTGACYPSSMSFELLIAGLLGGVAAAVSGYALYLFARAFGIAFPFSIEALREKRRAKLLREVDAIVEQSGTEPESLKRAVLLLKRSIGIRRTHGNLRASEANVSLHEGLLGRIVVLADKFGRDIEQIALVENLLTARRELLRNLEETRETLGSINQRQREKGRETAEWAVSEYTKRLAELKERAATNAQTIEGQFARLLQVLERAPDTAHEDVTIH